MDIIEYLEAHPPDEEIELIECPYCDEGMANVEDVCVWCKGTTWIDEDLT